MAGISRVRTPLACVRNSGFDSSGGAVVPSLLARVSSKLVRGAKLSDKGSVVTGGMARGIGKYLPASTLSFANEATGLFGAGPARLDTGATGLSSLLTGCCALLASSWASSNCCPKSRGWRGAAGSGAKETCESPPVTHTALRPPVGVTAESKGRRTANMQAAIDSTRCSITPGVALLTSQARTSTR